MIANLPFYAQYYAMWLFAILQGLSGGLRFQESPLYRYPYRNAREAMRGDAKRVLGDIELAKERFYD